MYMIATQSTCWVAVEHDELVDSAGGGLVNIDEGNRVEIDGRNISRKT